MCWVHCSAPYRCPTRSSAKHSCCARGRLSLCPAPRGRLLAHAPHPHTAVARYRVASPQHLASQSRLATTAPQVEQHLLPSTPLQPSTTVLEARHAFQGWAGRSDSRNCFSRGCRTLHQPAPARIGPAACARLPFRLLLGRSCIASICPGAPLPQPALHAPRNPSATLPPLALTKHSLPLHLVACAPGITLVVTTTCCSRRGVGGQRDLLQGRSQGCSQGGVTEGDAPRQSTCHRTGRCAPGLSTQRAMGVPGRAPTALAGAAAAAAGLAAAGLTRRRRRRCRPAHSRTLGRCHRRRSTPQSCAACGICSTLRATRGRGAHNRARVIRRRRHRAGQAGAPPSH